MTVPAHPRKVDRKRWRRDIARHLEDFPRGVPRASYRAAVSSVGLGDLDAKSLRGACEASVVAVQTFEVFTQADGGCEVQGVE